jgi:hypothetical protein
MLFRFGEAFAAAGFDCYSVDQAGYGESPLVAGRGVTATLPWPSLQVIASGNSCPSSIEE